MDLVEIRKKAKSRKKRVEQKAAVGPEGSDPIADPGTSPEEGPGTDLGRDAPAKMEENREGESRILQSEEDTGGREEESQTHGALTSLKGVLMSQREQEEEEEEEEQLQLLVFLLGQEEYALNIMDIKEIIKPRDVTEVPKAPDYSRHGCQ
jgi:purine-binding chemotaxis protein CheW